MGSKSDTHIILLPEIGKSLISRIELDFENCEGVYLDQKEIVDMQITFNKELSWGSGDYVRQIESGFLKIKLDPEQNEWRENSLFDKLAKGEIYDLTVKLGGTISGEHGIGLEKRAYISKVVNSTALNYMREIKKVFDPNNILNPDKIFKL